MKVQKKNPIVPYHSDSRRMARELTKNISNDYEKFRAIGNYLDRTIAYDYIRAITIPKKNGKPDVARCWRERKGICMDIASLATGMMREVGLDTDCCWGYADGNWHAWAECRIGGKTYRYDHGNAKVQVYDAKLRY